MHYQRGLRCACMSIPPAINVRRLAVVPVHHVPMAPACPHALLHCPQLHVMAFGIPLASARAPVLHALQLWGRHNELVAVKGSEEAEGASEFRESDTAFGK